MAKTAYNLFTDPVKTITIALAQKVFKKILQDNGFPEENIAGYKGELDALVKESNNIHGEFNKKGAADLEIIVNKLHELFQKSQNIADSVVQKHNSGDQQKMKQLRDDIDSALSLILLPNAEALRKIKGMEDIVTKLEEHRKKSKDSALKAMAIDVATSEFEKILHDNGLHENISDYKNELLIIIEDSAKIHNEFKKMDPTNQETKSKLVVDMHNMLQHSDKLMLSVATHKYPSDVQKRTKLQNSIADKLIGVFVADIISIKNMKGMGDIASRLQEHSNRQKEENNKIASENGTAGKTTATPDKNQKVGRKQKTEKGKVSAQTDEHQSDPSSTPDKNKTAENESAKDKTAENESAKDKTAKNKTAAHTTPSEKKTAGRTAATPAGHKPTEHEKAEHKAAAGHATDTHHTAAGHKAAAGHNTAGHAADAHHKADDHHKAAADAHHKAAAAHAADAHHKADDHHKAAAAHAADAHHKAADKADDHHKAAAAHAADAHHKAAAAHAADAHHKADTHHKAAAAHAADAHHKADDHHKAAADAHHKAAAAHAADAHHKADTHHKAAAAHAAAPPRKKKK